MEISELRAICKPENFQITVHAAERYHTDYPFPSCLILGKSSIGEIVHAVIGSDTQRLWIITAYKPDKEKWDNGYKIRKEL